MTTASKNECKKGGEHEVIVRRQHIAHAKREMLGVVQVGSCGNLRA